jgi:RNA polymerase sigma-70 factor (ECF subfamily)
MNDRTPRTRAAFNVSMTDLDRFEALVNQYQDAVFATAVRIVDCAAEAEDIAQEVFLRAYERFSVVVKLSSPCAWLRTVARHLSLNWLRRKRRCRLFCEMSSPEPHSAPFDDLPARESVERTVAENSRRALLHRALDRLPPAQRVPLLLFHYEDKSYEEIARTLHISLAKVKTDIFRARHALRRHLQPHWESLCLPDTWAGTSDLRRTPTVRSFAA